MKIRQGFVSNSSSSSFVVVVPVGTDVYAPFEGLMKEIAEEAFSGSREKILGVDAIVYEGYSSDEGCWSIREAAAMEDVLALPENEGKEDYEVSDEIWGKFTSQFEGIEGAYMHWNEQ